MLSGRVADGIRQVDRQDGADSGGGIVNRIAKGAVAQRGAALESHQRLADVTEEAIGTDRMLVVSNDDPPLLLDAEAGRKS